MRRRARRSGAAEEKDPAEAPADLPEAAPDFARADGPHEPDEQRRAGECGQQAAAVIWRRGAVGGTPPSYNRRAMLPASFQMPAAIILMVGGLLSCFAGYRIFRFVLAFFGFVFGALFGELGDGQRSDAVDDRRRYPRRARRCADPGSRRISSASR